MRPIRVAISNVLLGDDYTGKLYVGAQQKEVNLLLDTGSSTLAVERRSYDPQRDSKARVTNLVQEVAYEDRSSWIGSVVRTDVRAKSGGRAIDLPAVSVAVAYHATADMFGKAQGILGLAYAPLNTAYDLKRPTVPPKYTPNEVRTGHVERIEPYFTQLEKAKLVANKYAFLTRRSVVRASRNPAADPLNHGTLILGGGEEATDLYSGSFKSVAVLSDNYYDVNLKQVIVGTSGAIVVPPPTRHDDVASNAIIDSGTNGLDLDPKLFDAILAKMTSDQRKLMLARRVANESIKFADWPVLTFVLEGESADVKLLVKPEDYWQLDGGEAGVAVRSLWRGTDVQSTLGLPLMNGYLTIFDDGANHGLGVVKFAVAK